MNYPAYPAYKPSGIEWLGDMPEHWKTPPMYCRYRIELGKMLNEGRITGQFLLPYLRNVDVQWDKINLEALPEMDIHISEYQRYTLASGDLLVCEGGEIGRAAMWNEDMTIGFQKALHRLRPRDKNEATRFMFYVMYWAASTGVFLGGENPNTISHLTGERLRRYRFPAPPLEEQRAIADFLDNQTAKLDALVAKKRAIIEKLKEKRIALISRTVTRGLPPDAATAAGFEPHPQLKPSGVEWLGDVPKHWLIKAVKYVSRNMISGPFGSSLTKDKYTDSGYRIYGQEQVIPGDFAIGDYYIPANYFSEMKRYAVEVGDVLVSCVGTFGKVAVVPQGIEPGIINPRLILIRPDKRLIFPEYLGTLIRSNFAHEQLQSASRGGTMDIINMGLLGNLIIPLPPLPEQRSITDFLDRETAKIDRMIEKVEAAIEKLQEYRTALITAAVTGKIDVREI